MFIRSKAPRGAFTLIEILVVIGVIALLAAIMFPVFGKVRENGRRTACTSNLRQLGLAFQQYSQDNGGRYPFSATFYTAPDGQPCFGASCSGWRPNAGNWVVGNGLTTASPTADVNASNLALPNSPFTYVDGKTADPKGGSLFQYTKEESIYYCPSNADGQKKRLSYSMNCALTALSSSRIRTPSDIVLLVDEEYANDGYFYAVSPGAGKSGSPNPSTDALTKKHNGGGNILFADGRVKFFSTDNFPLDDTAQGLANKWKTAGSPRFHDRAFGPYGSSSPSVRNANIQTDYCNATAGPGNNDGTGNFGTTTPTTP